MKFKVGDKVRGISDNFKITNKDMTLAEVMSVEPLGIRVKILEHTNKSQIGKICVAITFEEHLAHFELVEEKNMNKIDELEMKLKELSEEIEQLKAEKENGVWKPKDGDKYWFISYSGGEVSTVWHGDAVDERRYLLGNAFKTEQETQFEVEKLKVEAELRRFGRKFVPKRENYYFKYAHQQDSIFIPGIFNDQGNDIYFETAEIARKAIETVGENRIKKYYFGVED